MATYIKSVSNSIEQGRDFPVTDIMELSDTYKNMHVMSLGTSKWQKNKPDGTSETFYIGKIRVGWDSILPKVNVYNNWRKHFIPLNKTYKYGGNNRYSFRFNIGNGKYFCTDAYDVFGTIQRREYGKWSQFHILLWVSQLTQVTIMKCLVVGFRLFTKVKLITFLDIVVIKAVEVKLSHFRVVIMVTFTV